MNPKKRDRVSQLLYHTCKQNCKAKRKSRKIKHRWDNRTLDMKKKRTKKMEITLQTNLSVAIQISRLDDLIDFFFGQLITKVHHGPLEFFSTYKPVTIHVQHFEHFSYLCFCVCFFHPGVHQVEKFSKVNDAISSKRKM